MYGEVHYIGLCYWTLCSRGINRGSARLIIHLHKNTPLGSKTKCTIATENVTSLAGTDVIVFVNNTQLDAADQFCLRNARQRIEWSFSARQPYEPGLCGISFAWLETKKRCSVDAAAGASTKQFITRTDIPTTYHTNHHLPLRGKWTGFNPWSAFAIAASPTPFSKRCEERRNEWWLEGSPFRCGLSGGERGAHQAHGYKKNSLRDSNQSDWLTVSYATSFKSVQMNSFFLFSNT